MTATTFTDLGSSTPAGSSTTIVLTIGANVNVGDNVFAVCGNLATTGDTYTFSDSQGNAWLTDVQATTTGRSGHATGHSTITVAMTSGVDTITCTCNNSRGDRVICAWIETTPGATYPLATGQQAPSDGASSATYTGSTASCGSRTPTSNPDLDICVFSTGNTSVSLGTVTNFTQRYHLLGTVSAEYEVYGITNLTTSNTALAPTLTLGGANPGVGSQVVFKYQGNPVWPPHDLRNAIPFTQGAGGGSPGGGF